MRRRAHPRVRRRARVAARGDSRHYARRRRAFRAPRVQRASARARCRRRRVSRAFARARRRASRESTRACEERDVVNDARASGMARVRARARPFARSRGRRTRVDARSRDCAIAPRRSTRVGARASVETRRFEQTVERAKTVAFGNANRRFVVAQSARSSPRDAREFDARRNDFDDEVGPGSGGILRYVFAFARAFGGGRRRA